MKAQAQRATLDDMTDLASAPETAPSAIELNHVAVRELHSMPDLDRVDRLFTSIWDPDQQQPPISAHTLRALSHAGSYVSGAFDGDSLVGACVGIFGPPQTHILHSHIAGVTPEAQGRRVGYLLKAHQHAWARAHQVREITWTFDPLVRRNAHFNIVKLGALPKDYLVDFYGEMSDGINAGQGSDRLLLSWDPAVPITGRLDTRPGATTILAPSNEERPVLTDAGSASRVLIGVPENIERLRRTDPDLSRSWRAALRDVLCGLLADGATVTGFTATGEYVVERNR